MAEVEKKAPKGQFRVISRPLFGEDYKVRDWSSFSKAAADADEMHGGMNLNEFFVYDDQGKLVYDPALKGE